MMPSFLKSSLLAAFIVVLGCGDDGSSTAGSGGGSSTSAAQTTTSTGSGSSIATSSTAASSNASSTSSGTPGCDQDGDGVDRAGAGCCGAPDPCDCDDMNPDVFPDQMMFFVAPRPGVDPMSGMAWDYNCDGKQEKEFPQDSDGCVILQCIADEAFQGDNGEYFCGVSGVLITCEPLSCEVTGNIDLACR